MLAEVYIATTHGLVSIQSINSLGDPDVSSVATVNHTSKLAGISNEYANFVAKPTGIIQSEFQDLAYRLNISSDISHGQSWQLGCYIAHYLKAYGVLFEDNAQKQEKNKTQIDKNVVIIATGVIDTVNRRVLKVESLPRKCLTANSQVQSWLKCGKKVVFLAPIDNLKEPIPDSSIQLTPVHFIEELKNLFLALGLIDSDFEHDSNNKPSLNPVIVKKAPALNGKIDTQNHELLSEPHLNSRVEHTRTDKFNNLKTWILSSLLVIVLVVMFFVFSKQSYTVLGLISESGRGGECTGNVSTVNFFKIASNNSTVRNTDTFTANASFLQNLCALKLLTSKDISSILMVTDSKGLMQLSFSNMIDKADHELLEAYNGDISAETGLLRWEIPLPTNRDLSRFYYLIISMHQFDAAEIQTLESELLKIYQQGRQVTDKDILQILATIQAQPPVATIFHSLEKN